METEIESLSITDPTAIPPIHIIIVPAIYRERCDVIAIGLSIGYLTTALVPEDGEDDAEATYWGVEGSMHDYQRIDLLAALSLPENADIAANAYWIRRYNHGVDINKVQASHDGLRIGELWSWAKSLEELGIKNQILPEIEDMEE